MKMLQLLSAAAFISVTAFGANAAAAQNTLSQFIYNTMKLTPATEHSSEFVPGALLEVPLKGKNTKWQVVDNREVEKRGIHTPAVEELTATSDPFQVNKPTNIKIGIDSIMHVFAGASVDAHFDKNHEVSVSEIKEKGYVLAGTEDQDLLKSGKLHDWLLANYFTYPHKEVAYFIIKRVYTAQYAEITVNQGFDVGAALGGKDTGTCSDVSLPAALANPGAQGTGAGAQGAGAQGAGAGAQGAGAQGAGAGAQGAGAQGAGAGAQGAGAQGAGAGAQGAGAQGAGAGAQGAGTQGAGAGAQGAGTQQKSSLKVGGTYCHPDKEHVRFFATEWAPIALEVELITRINDNLDVKPGVVFLPLYDVKKTASVANSLF